MVKKVSSTIKGVHTLIITNHVEAFMSWFCLLSSVFWHFMQNFVRKFMNLGDTGPPNSGAADIDICRRTITGVGYMWAVSPLIKLMTGLTFLDKLHPDYLHSNGYSDLDTTWPHTAHLFMLFVLDVVISYSMQYMCD